MLNYIWTPLNTIYCTLQEVKRAKIEYRKSQQPITATVLKESYKNQFEKNPEKHISGLVSQAYSNETVKIRSKYTLKIKTENGKLMGLSIIDGGSVKKESLDQLIDKDSKISFPKGNWIKPYSCGQDKKETYIRKDTQTATKRADRIKVLNPK